jgi:hypothetical protein
MLNEISQIDRLIQDKITTIKETNATKWPFISS